MMNEVTGINPVTFRSWSRRGLLEPFGLSATGETGSFSFLQLCAIRSAQILISDGFESAVALDAAARCLPLFKRVTKTPAELQRKGEIEESAIRIAWSSAGDAPDYWHQWVGLAVLRKSKLADTWHVRLIHPEEFATWLIFQDVTSAHTLDLAKVAIDVADMLKSRGLGL